jgi:hypothetical protein
MKYDMFLRIATELQTLWSKYKITSLERHPGGHARWNLLECDELPRTLVGASLMDDASDASPQPPAFPPARLSSLAASRLGHQEGRCVSDNLFQFWWLGESGRDT